ncbi:unnamed protein product [Notodromas monacha]|uniref:Tubulin-specific chaperone A n=1 Tax=Notodromas monacha TaxID=399045 RepID=A0A7R9BSE4_9CRUS|nr:unnamed protein product [Notodromas monacha]CAG0920828.1 unnamed protein product [Notodromas monacha]
MSAETQDVPMEESPAPEVQVSKNDPRLRSIKIKTGSVKRLHKDVLYYQKELVQHTEKVEKMKADGAPAKEVLHWEDMKNETSRVIPDVTRRLKETFEDLKNVLQQEDDLKEEEVYKVAEAALNEAAGTIQAV